MLLDETETMSENSRGEIEEKNTFLGHLQVVSAFIKEGHSSITILIDLLKVSLLFDLLSNIEDTHPLWEITKEARVSLTGIRY